MGTVLFQKRHYEKLAEYLKEIEAPKDIVKQLCIKLYIDNKYFKPTIFLSRCGLPKAEIEDLIKRLELYVVSYH
jgi:hypothetical protein